MTTTTQHKQQGFTAYVLRSAEVELRILPELGAKISSLINRRTGREWMWSPPGRLRLHRNKTGDPFPESTVLGADECLPTIAACQWKGRPLTDHGEAWTEAWDVEQRANAIVTRLRLPISPLAIERTVTLRGRSVRIDYRLTNTGADVEEYLWALHPLLTVREGDRLDVPCTRVRCDLPFGGRRRAWPVEVRAGAAVKVFTEDLAQGCVAIRNDRTGEALEFSFDHQMLSTVGLWINRGGWNGYQHVAIEPTNGAPDALNVAVRKWRRFGVVRPNETKHWRVTLTCH